MSSTLGLTLAEQLQHAWAAPFDLRVQGFEARPASRHFQSLVTLSEGKGALLLRLSKPALEHPTTGPELERLRWEFLSANLGTPEEGLREWLNGPGKEPHKSAERRVEVALDGDSVVYTVAKARSKFWPFS